jgi:hypothetical protein
MNGRTYSSFTAKVENESTVEFASTCHPAEAPSLPLYGKKKNRTVSCDCVTTVNTQFDWYGGFVDIVFQHKLTTTIRRNVCLSFCSARDDTGQKVFHNSVLFCLVSYSSDTCIFQVFFQPESEYVARVTVTAQGLQSAHSCVMKWRLCDPSLDAIIGPCPVHSGALADVAADQVCGAFTVCDPLSVEPTQGFDFAFGAAEKCKSGDRVRVEVDVSKHMTVVYEGVASVVKHSTLGAFDEIFCDRGLCLQSVTSSRYLNIVEIIVSAP